MDSEGFTIRNGGTGEKNCEKALMFIGGTNEYTMDGAFQNWGEYYQNGSASIEGWRKNQAVIADVDTPYAVIFQQNSKTYFNGSLYCNWNGVLTVHTAFVFVEGNLEFGTMLANMGTTYVTGDIATRDTKNHSGNKAKYNSKYCTIRNGALSYNTKNNLFSDAVLFCGGTMTLGSSESGGEAGSVMSAQCMSRVTSMIIVTRTIRIIVLHSGCGMAQIPSSAATASAAVLWLQVITLSLW